MDDKNVRALPFVTRNQLDFQHASSFALVLQTIGPSSEPIEIRGFTKEGPFTYVATPAGTSTLETFTFKVPDVPVQVSVMMNPASGVIKRSYAILHLSINGNRATVLAQGAVSAVYGISWPHKLEETYPQKEGAPEIVTFANGGVDEEEYSTQIPDNQFWEILDIRCILACSASAANRLVTVGIGPASEYRVFGKTATNITANQNPKISFLAGGTSRALAELNVQEVAMPQKMFTTQGAELYFFITNAQTGDQLTNISMLVKRHFVRTT